jgi:lytic murein transglycosylase
MLSALRILLLTLLFAASESACAETATTEAFRNWIATFRADALQSGIRPQVYDSVTAGLNPDFSLPDLDIPSRPATGEQQAEFVRTPEEYLSEKYLGNLAGQGRSLFAKHKDTLAHIEKTYGTDPYVLLALWARETAFGTYRLPYSGLQVLSTQAYIGRRKELFRKQFLYAIRMVQDGVIKPGDMKSSWAGAMGLVQFLPEDYYKYAVDADGDGKRDIWHSVPDALASLANNLSHIGWDKTQPWGFEVRAPKSIDCSLGYLDIRKPVREWAALGIKPLQGDAFPKEALDWEASLLQPAGTFGPAFLTFNNFQVLREYNKADLYALFVGHLADRMRGSNGFSHSWERIVQVSTKDVEDMQRRLTALGLYSDTIDGKAGGRTRSAVGLYQKKVGMAQTCWPTASIIAHLKANASGEAINTQLAK